MYIVCYCSIVYYAKYNVIVDGNFIQSKRLCDKQINKKTETDGIKRLK